MVNQPWIKIFVGDWIRDTRKLSMRARGAYADLKMQLWISDIRGVITGDITDVSLLLGISYTETELLLQELQQKKAFKIELCNNTCYNIIDEAMIQQQEKSAVKSKAGKAAMKKRWQKKEKDDYNSVITNDIAEPITPYVTPVITYTDIDNGNDTNNERGDAGGENKNQKPLYVKSGAEILSLPNCLQAFLETNICGMVRDLIKKRLLEQCLPTLLEKPGLDELLRRWGERFNETLSGRLLTHRSLNEWTSHFQNWIPLQDLKIHPSITTNANRNNRTAPTTTTKSNATASNQRGGTIDELEGLKRGRAGSNTERTEFTEAEVVK